MSVVKKYKGYDVPEGATHFRDGCESYHPMFIKIKDGNQSRILASGINKWSDGHNYVDNLIELPQEPEPDKWVPKVGEWCEVESDVRNVWKKAMYVGIDSVGSHVFDVEKRHLWRIDSVDILVRPIKTEREQFIEAAKSVWNGKYVIESILGELYDAGCRFNLTEKGG